MRMTKEFMMSKVSYTFVLRCWREPTKATAAGEAAVWRFILENPRTAERHSFATWAELTAFVERLVQEEEE